MLGKIQGIYQVREVYVNNPEDPADLKNVIRDETAAISRGMPKKVFENFVKPMQECIKPKVCHLEDIILKINKYVYIFFFLNKNKCFPEHLLFVL